MKDFSDSKVAPVLVCFVFHGDKVLLLKRSDTVMAYKNMWSCVAGFLDDGQFVRDKAFEEMREELGLNEADIIEIKEGPVYEYEDKKIGRTWIRHLAKAVVSNPNVKLDFEHSEYKWVSPEEVKNFETTPGLLDDLRKIEKI